MNFFKNQVVVFGVATMIERIISFFILPILTTTLSEVEFAIWSQLVIVSGVLVPVVLLGFSQLIVRFYPEWENSGYQITDIYWKLLACIIIFIVVQSIILVKFQHFFSILIFGNESNYQYISLIIFFVFLESFFEITLSTLRSINKIQLVSIYTIIKAIFRLLSIYYLFVYLDISFIESLIWYSVLNLTVVAILFIGIGLKTDFFGIKVDKKRLTIADLRGLGIISDAFRYASPLVFIAIVIPVVSFSDRFFIANLIGLDALSGYSAAYTISAVVALGYSIVGYVAFPKLANLFVLNEKQRCGSVLNSTLLFFSGIFFPYLTFMTLAGPELLLWLSGPDYLVSREIFLLLVLSIGLFGFFQIFQYVLLLEKSTTRVGSIVFFGAILNLSLNWFLVSHFNLLGAALSNCMTNSILAVLGTYFSRKILNFRFPIKELSTIISFSVFTYFLGRFVLPGYYEGELVYLILSAVVVGFSFLMLYVFVPKVSIFKSLNAL